MSSNDGTQTPVLTTPLINLKQFAYKPPSSAVETANKKSSVKQPDVEGNGNIVTPQTINNTSKEHHPVKAGVKRKEKPKPSKKRFRIVSDTESEPDLNDKPSSVIDDQPTSVRDDNQTQQLPTSSPNDGDGQEQDDLKSRIRTSYSTISKSLDIVASFNSSPCSSKGSDANGKISLVTLKRKRPFIFSSDDDDDGGGNEKKPDSKTNGERVEDQSGGTPASKKIIAKMAGKRNPTSPGKGKHLEVAVNERENSLAVLRSMFPVFDNMECQEVLAFNSWSIDESIKFLDALPTEGIDDCLSTTPKSEILLEGSNAGAKKKRIRSNGIRRQRKGVRFISDSDSDEEVVYRIKPPQSEDAPPKPKREKPDGEKRKKKKKKVRASAGSDSGDSYDRMDDIIYDSDASDDDDTLTPARNIIFEFYQTAKVEELLSVPGCAKKKVDVILELRPFSGWLDLVCKFRSGKGLSTDLLNNAKDSLNSQRAVTQLMHNCEKLAERLEARVARLMSEGNFGDDEGHLKKQPALLNPKLHLTPYQLLGVNWLLLLHRQKVNGILADEMGLGKTIQATAFLTHLLEEGDDGPHLIVVPTSTVDNWVRELKTWSPKLQVLIYQGNQMERRFQRRAILSGRESSFNVIVTSYNLVASNTEDRSLFRRILFRYVIFDEAHLLKNMQTQRYQNLMKINANRRLLLTGTPLQNNLVELMSLLVFVMPNMFDGKREHLKIVFSMASKDDREETRGVFEKERISHAKRIMKPFVLRRLKVDVLKYLPTKTEEVEYCPMNDGQQRTYKELVETFAREARENGAKALCSRGSGIIMQLRKLANHPLLLRYHFTDEKLRKMAKLMLTEPTHRDANEHLVFEDMQVMSDFELHKLCGNFKCLSSFTLDRQIIIDSGKFSFLDRTLPLLKSKGHRILLFSQFVMVLDIVEEYMKIVGHNYLRLDGSTPVSERLQLIDQYTNDDSIFVFLLSTKAGGLGINLTAANTVILHDIDFNPYNDKQAEDRCHRVGQTKEVRVIRLISKDTIEEGMLQMGTKKLKLEKELASQESDLREGDAKNVVSLLEQVLKL